MPINAAHGNFREPASDDWDIESRLTGPEYGPADGENEFSLRPRNFDEYVGQDAVKENLSVFIAAARERGDCLDHVLLHGPPGLGKTTLSCIIASELGVNLKHHLRPGHRESRRSGRAADHAQPQRRAVHRRNPPPAPRGRGGPVSGDGGLRARPDDRQGPVGALDPRSTCSPSRSSARRRVAGMLTSPLRDRFGDAASGWSCTRRRSWPSS